MVNGFFQTNEIGQVEVRRAEDRPLRSSPVRRAPARMGIVSPLLIRRFHSAIPPLPPRRSNSASSRSIQLTVISCDTG